MRTQLIAAVCAASVLGSVADAAVLSIREGSGATPADIQPIVDQFRADLGVLNDNLPQNLNPNGRRQINWDAAPDSISDPNLFPGDFFNGTTPGRARGITFSNVGAGTGFQLSSTSASGEPVAFSFPGTFTPFSPERLFAPMGSTTFDITFSNPAAPGTPALSRGLGIVFTDVEAINSTSLTFFDVNGTELLSRTVETAPNAGLSFVGATFTTAEVARVRVIAGSAAFDGSDFFPLSGDAVAIDDVIFGEPIALSGTPVPLPGALPFLVTGLLGLFGIRRARRSSTL